MTGYMLRFGVWLFKYENKLHFNATSFKHAFVVSALCDLYLATVSMCRTNFRMTLGMENFTHSVSEDLFVIAQETVR